MIKDHKVKTWEQLIAALYNIPKTKLKRYRSNFVYRGVASKAWGLETSLKRLGPACVDVERPLLRSFAKYAQPGDIPSDRRIAFHASATSAGLQTAIDTCAFEGGIIELSWHGATAVTVHLGGAFHSRRLQIISSQVGHVAPSHRSRTSHRDRLERAMALLDDPALDVLVSDSILFHELPDALPRIWSSATLPPVVCY